MEDSTVNSQITDAVTQVNTEASDDAPATAIESSAQELNAAAVNAAHAKQEGNMIMQATTIMGAGSIGTIGPEMTDTGAADVQDMLDKQATDIAPE